ncbi:hypothetical protein COCCADRAFT_91395 [Bipolaris zeicola 26-R-13]|uniref:Uncharacterized protein n=1 Tax=Cochliobolus carbonum (strain 26-R-13) TaxID=930089 RepID=W6YHW7_COCC2|nr:uncharacterized protein COCCADRAFT_91395 [Bipolaris zeicola 26-R-13]EUC35229.1 hypothetical protein COCCADRAFT_91395 [Bipolaris zeicola 26-R-13]
MLRVHCAPHSTYSLSFDMYHLSAPTARRDTTTATPKVCSVPMQHDTCLPSPR